MTAASKRGRARARVGALLFVLLVGIVAPACGGGTNGSGTAPPPKGGAAPVASRTGPPTGVDPAVVFHGRGDALLTDDMVVEAYSENDVCRLTAYPLADPATSRWTFQESDGRQIECRAPNLAGSGLVAAYVKPIPSQGVEPARAEHGLVALDTGGKVRWRVSVGGIDSVAGADDRIVVATDDQNYANDEVDNKVEPTTAVLDATDGSILWRRRSLVGLGLDGQTLVAVQLSPADGRQYRSGTLVGLDAATGQQRWRWTEKAISPREVVLIGGGMVVQNTSRSKGDNPWEGVENRVLFRDAQTGAVRHEERDARENVHCVSDTHTAVVCLTNGNGSGPLFAYDLTTRRRTWSLAGGVVEKTHIELRSMVDGRLFVAADSGGALLDATTGQQLAANLPTAPHQVRGAYGVVDGNAQYDVYRIRG